MPDVRNESVRVAFTSEEKRKLVESARIEGRSLADYIRERVLAECRVEDEVLHFLLNDLARAAMPLQRAGTGQPDPDDASAPQELPEQQRARIAKEVRASFVWRADRSFVPVLESCVRARALARPRAAKWEDGRWAARIQMIPCPMVQRASSASGRRWPLDRGGIRKDANRMDTGRLSSIDTVCGRCTD